MTNIIFCCLLFLGLFNGFSQKNQFKKAHLMLSDIHNIDLQNGTIIVINNRACGSYFCGNVLHSFIKQQMPNQNQSDSIIWLYSLEDSALVSSIKQVDHDFVNLVSRTNLNRYGILTVKYAAVSVKNGEIKRIKKFDEKYTYR